MSERRIATLATTVGLAVGGGLLILFVDGVLLSQILAAPVFGPAWEALTRLGAALTGTAPPQWMWRREATSPGPGRCTSARSPAAC